MRLKIQLLILVLFAAVPVVAVQVYDELTQRAERRANMEHEVLRLARLAGAQQAQFIGSLQSILVTAAQLPQLHGVNRTACPAALASLSANFEEVMAVAAVAPDGSVLCNSIPLPTPVSIADRDYFQRAIRRETLAVSKYIVGRTTGRGAIALAYPALDASGAVEQVMVLWLDVAQLSTRLATMPLPAGAIAGLVDRDGYVVARSPYVSGLIGHRGHGGKAVPLLAAHREGSFVATDPTGGKRFYAFARFPGPSELTAYIGLPRAGMFAESDRLFWQEMALIGLGFGLAALAALLAGDWWIRRPILTLRHGVQRMRQGDLSTRAELSDVASQELTDLADSVNTMADALQSEQRALRAERTRLETVLQQMPAGLMIAEAPSGKLVLGNKQVEKIWRRPYRPADSIVDYGTYLGFHPDGRPYQPHEWPLARSIARGETVIDEEIDFERGDGSLGTMTVCSTPLRDEAGKVAAAVTTFHDITERKQADQRQRLLMAELDHRVKNTLAAVNSILAQTLRGGGSPERFSEAFRGRVQALARAHNLLTQSRWEGAGLRGLIANELKPFGGAESPQIGIRGNDLVVSNKAALALSMVMHELATNASKYGALSVSAGRLTISWTIEASAGDPRLLLDWVETGGPAVSPPTTTGFGCKLISRSLSYELNGTARLDFPPEGVRCRIEIPLSELGRRRAAAARPGAGPQAPAGPLQPADGALRALRGKRLLVVEDSLLVAMELENALRALGCELVGPAMRIEQAIELVEREPLDGALLDIDIDGETIYRVADELLRRDIPFIFATGYDGQLVLPGAYRDLTVVQKPFSQEELRDAMARAFAQPRDSVRQAHRQPGDARSMPEEV